MGEGFQRYGSGCLRFGGKVVGQGQLFCADQAGDEPKNSGWHLKSDREAAIHGDDLASNVGGIGAREKGGDTGDFLRLSGSAQGEVVSLDVIIAEPVGMQFVDTVGTDTHLSINKTRRNGVDENA